MNVEKYAGKRETPSSSPGYVHDEYWQRAIDEEAAQDAAGAAAEDGARVAPLSPSSRFANNGDPAVDIYKQCFRAVKAANVAEVKSIVEPLCVIQREHRECSLGRPNRRGVEDGEVREVDEDDLLLNRRDHLPDDSLSHPKQEAHLRVYARGILDRIVQHEDGAAPAVLAAHSHLS
eukprot:CAMPEP_0206319312 /NCGR_PEP_ID=MMETSP0106_2-20121207/17688_1 /ASSEMBLY_ACC=CAM_ASM_000206 /TAXON_ID=81532 /ORGANISM="Acanthoeca-like sp., Strain 10tr" /LENGTH=175 /DNA_ID=CAMNT_0053751135 /DNA_START=86 /DNA_END=611 /DNA_ORIENTATION=-